MSINAAGPSGPVSGVARREPATEHAVKTRPVLAAVLRVTGILGMIFTPLIGLILAFAGVAPVALAVFVIGGIASQRALHYAKRLRARGAIDVLQDDPRAPVLYLRSFAADERAAEPVGTAFNIRGIDFTVVMTEEEQIARVAQRIGPFVGIGRPHEHLPALGAARMYLSDDQWQGKVHDLMSRSSLVLMRAGMSEGFFWEVSQLPHKLRPEQVLWLIPFSHVNYAAFAERVNSLLPQPLPPNPAFGRKIGSLWGWIWFSRDWTPHFEPCTAGDSSHRGAPICAMMQRAFGPTFLGLGRPSDALYCGGLRRYAAGFIDWIVVLCVAGAVTSLGRAMDAEVAGSVLGVLLGFCYLTVMDKPEMGGTLGKRLNHLQVLSRDGGSPGNAQLAVRALVKLVLLSFLPLVFVSIDINQSAAVTFGLFGLVIALMLYMLAVWGWSTRRRMLQDYLTGTWVVEQDVQRLLRVYDNSTNRPIATSG